MKCYLKNWKKQQQHNAIRGMRHNQRNDYKATRKIIRMLKHRWKRGESRTYVMYPIAADLKQVLATVSEWFYWQLDVAGLYGSIDYDDERAVYHVYTSKEECEQMGGL